MDAEDEQRTAANGLDGVGNNVLHPALEPDDDGKDAQARRGIQQDAHGAEGPLGHRDAVGALGKKHQCGHSQRRRDHPAAQTGREGLFKDLILLGKVAHIQSRNGDHALADAKRSLPGDTDTPA